MLRIVAEALRLVLLLGRNVVPRMAITGIIQGPMKMLVLWRSPRLLQMDAGLGHGCKPATSRTA